MNDIINEQQMGTGTLLKELESIGIEGDSEKPGLIYVTELPFNFWISTNDKTRYLTLSTYSSIAETEDELETLRFVNELNDAWSLMQFSASREPDRLHAFYMLSYKGGLLRAQFRRTLVHFSNIFAGVVSEGQARGLMVPAAAQPLTVQIGYK
jgi:hypothetical protein